MGPPAIARQESVARNANFRRVVGLFSTQTDPSLVLRMDNFMEIHRLVLAQMAGQATAAMNPTIRALFPGKTTLNIVRNVDSSKTLAADVTSFGPAKSVFAQLWYEGEEQFFCTAENCGTNDEDKASDWTCHDLKCNCRTNATFCGAQPAISIKNTIDSLKGDLEIKCTTKDDGTTSCTFLQETINS
ncbi:hypothetical protein FRC17_005927, partial [Serendipita sp. 399]